MRRVFLSYAREDEDAAQAIASALEARGFELWWDRHLHGGAEYADHIERAIGDSAAVLVLWSRHSAASPWVRDEAALGRDQGKLIPASLDGSDPPIGFRQYHTVALGKWRSAPGEGLPPELERAIAAKLGGETGGDAAAAGKPEDMPEQEIRFCRASDGVRIAYSAVGEGPPVVKAANWINHLELEFESPLFSHWVRELSRGHRLIRYDERGNGMSDRDVEDISFERRVADLETVADAAGIERFDIVGISQGASIASAFAATRPKRVRRLVLVAPFVAGWNKVRDPKVTEQWQAMLTLAKIGWGNDNPAFRQMFTSLFFPEATAEQAHWWNRLQQASATPEQAQRLIQAMGEIDVRDYLPRVQAPTLVMHAREDAAIPFEAGRDFASRIPGARFVALESRNHLLSSGEPAWAKAVQQLRRFLGED